VGLASFDARNQDGRCASSASRSAKQPDAKYMVRRQSESLVAPAFYALTQQIEPPRFALQFAVTRSASRHPSGHAFQSFASIA
jgi:hypothetical protein